MGRGIETGYRFAFAQRAPYQDAVFRALRLHFIVHEDRPEHLDETEMARYAAWDYCMKYEFKKRLKEYRALRKRMRFSFRYLLRSVLGPACPIPCYMEATSGSKHYLSMDHIDDMVLREVLILEDIFFPKLTSEIVRELEEGGWILDVGAFNGYWTAEMLKRHWFTKSVLIEPNRDKCRNIVRTLRASGVLGRARIVAAALSQSDGRGWLIPSEEGSWGDYLETTVPAVNNGCREVATVTLEGTLEGIRPAVVKCNAEGGEFSLVAQLLTLDVRPKLIILMVHPERGNAGDLWDALIDGGYSISVVLDDARRPCWHAIFTRKDKARRE